MTVAPNTRFPFKPHVTRAFVVDDGRPSTLTILRLDSYFREPDHQKFVVVDQTVNIHGLGPKT